MNIRAYHRQQKQLADGQDAWDRMTPPDDEDEGLDDIEPDFEAMIEARERN